MNVTITSVEQCAYHRNGVGGIGFWAIIFHSPNDLNEDRRFLATVAAHDVEDHTAGRPVDPHVTVICLDLLDEYGVTFGPNSWRGDAFFAPLCEVITGTDWFAVERARILGEEEPSQP